MASKGNTVKLVFAGDSQSIEKTFKTVGSGADDMAKNVDRSSRDVSSSFDRLGDGADGFEQKTIGLRDAITGSGDVLKGFKEGDMTLVLTGFADLASSVANFAGPIIKSLLTRLGILTTATAAQTAATGAATGAQTGLNAALLANPIGIVVAAIAALVAIGFVVVKNWDTIKAAFSATWGWITDRFGDLVSFVGGLPRKIANVASGMWDGLKESFRSALNWIIDRWNSFRIPALKVAGLQVSPEVNFPDLQRFHTGGVVPGPAGHPVPIMALGGETISPNGGGGGGTTVNLTINTGVLDRDAGRWIADQLRDIGFMGIS